jgi:predicted nucleic acid-binding protein
MTMQLDTSLWIDFTRTRRLAALKQCIAPYVLDPATLADHINRSDLSVDLLVAAVALHHNAVLVSFDADFNAIASVSALRLHRLTRPA